MVADVADGVGITWSKEEIPPDARLYMRVHKNMVLQGKVLPGAFRNQGAGMSTDWEKYSTPEETRQRARKPPEEYAVISLIVDEVLQLPGQTVEHTPVQPNPAVGEPGNRAHTDVYGEKKKDPEVRKAFMRIYTMQLPLPEHTPSTGSDSS
jgi:hypothetical protein